MSADKGRLSPKDLFGWQANNSPDRLTRPLVRKNGELIETSWDEAMDLIVERSRRLLKEKGPLAFGFYTTGQLFLEEYYTQAVIGKASLRGPRSTGEQSLTPEIFAKPTPKPFYPKFSASPLPSYTLPPRVA